MVDCRGSWGRLPFFVPRPSVSGLTGDQATKECLDISGSFDNFPVPVSWIRSSDNCLFFDPGFLVDGDGRRDGGCHGAPH